MQIDTHKKNFQDFFQEDDNVKESCDARWNISKSIGEGSILKTEIKQGLDLLIMDYRLHKPFIVNHDDAPLTYGLGFLVSGNVRTRLHYVKDPVYTCSGENGITYLPHTCGSSEESGQRLGITISITPDLFCGFAQGEFERLADYVNTVSEGDKETFYFNKGQITPLMKIALHQILNCPYQGFTKRMYLESRSLELIVYKLEQMAAQGGDLKKTLSVKSDDLDRVHHAGEIIIRNLETPPTLFELAGMVGLSHAKLNRCFREVYGTTVFGFLRKTRLEQARFLLEEKQINVTEAAFSVGYSSLSSFIHAFSNHFGVKPSFCIKHYL